MRAIVVEEELIFNEFTPLLTIVVSFAMVEVVPDRVHFPLEAPEELPELSIVAVPSKPPSRPRYESACAVLLDANNAIITPPARKAVRARRRAGVAGEISMPPARQSSTRASGWIERSSVAGVGGATGRKGRVFME